MQSESFDIFSPKNFDEYIGQPRAKKIASVMVNAALIEQRSLPNILIDGSYGLGKTSLAKVIHLSMGITPRVIDASALNKDIPTAFSMLNKGKPIIVDEIHNLDASVADSLNILIDQGKLHILGCTTNAGALPAPFRSRFRSIHLEHYTVAEIQHIVELVCQRKGINPENKVLNDIAKRSRLNPRVAINHLAFMFDYMTVNGATALDSYICKSGFETLGVDTKGFIERDYRYMEALQEDRPVGLHYLSTMIGVDAKTIESEIEPFLLQLGYIDRMPRGRIKIKDLK